jgi:hypothetical protein
MIAGVKACLARMVSKDCGSRRVSHADNNQGQHQRSHDCYLRKGLRSYRGSASEVSVPREAYIRKWHIPEVPSVVSDGRLRFQGGLWQAGPGRVYEFTP